MIQVDADFQLAIKGFQIWHALLQTNQIKAYDLIFLLPSKVHQYNYCALALLDSFLNRKQRHKVFLLTYDEAVKESAFLFTDKNLEVIWFPREQAEALMKFYCLYEFTDQLIIASLEEPTGRLGKGFLKRPGMTLMELFALVVYQMENLSENRILYNGNNKKIIEFLNIENHWTVLSA